MTIIIVICSLLLLAYVFELISAKTKLPSVILLLLLGFAVQQLTKLFKINIPDLTFLLPILGTIGLILIILEGSLELEFNKSKAPLIIKSFIASLFPMLTLAFLLSLLFQYFGQVSFKVSLINAIPFCIISGAIVISSVKSLSTFNREFLIYESSFSEIFGILFFNFVAFNDSFGFHSVGHFVLQIIIITLVSFLATIGLSLLLAKNQHNIKFIPIILIIILIYVISKVYHLPGLIFILIFGLFLGNLDVLEQFKWSEKYKLDELKKEVIKFRELVIELTFLIKSLFFILFGFLIQTSEILNIETLIWSIVIVIAIFLFRYIQLKLLKLPIVPLLFIAPRGLITILLFITIEPAQNIPFVNKSLIIQVIVLTAIIMTVGFMINKE